MPASAHARNQGSGRDPELKRLLIRPGAIGDLIVSLPALELLAADYTEVWVAAQNVPLVRFADRVRSIAATGLDLVELGAGERCLSALREFDSIVSWYGTSRPEFRESVAGLPFTFYPALPEGSTCHATDFYMRQVGGADGAVPHIDCGSVGKRDFVAIHPFSGSAAKNWPLESFRAVARALRLPVEFCAGPEEELNDAVRFESLFDVATWLASARVYIGNDSGISHLAAAVGTPSVVIFRSSDPVVWAPRGDAVTVLRDPSVQPVLDSVESYRR